MTQFAYGGAKSIKKFLTEAATAASAFREHNPNISMAIVSNNATVDSRLFDNHVKPRPDLLFAGDTVNGGQNRSDHVPRQWLTRLYYLAHSPFVITWALDSNVISCTPGAAQAFLDSALRHHMWGYDIVHSSQGAGSMMYPHNWNILYLWSERTSSLLRDWLLLQMREGVAADDQKTLHVTELRHVAAGLIKVGQLAPPFGTAFFNARGNSTLVRSPRLTRVIVGRAHVIHSFNRSFCGLINHWSASNASLEEPRQMMTTGISCPRRPCGVNWHALRSEVECSQALGGMPCLFKGQPPPGPEEMRVMGVDVAFPAVMEPLYKYTASPRCGRLCEGIVDVTAASAPQRREDD